MDLRFERVVVPIAGTSADDRVLALVPYLVSKPAGSLTLLYVVAVAQSMPLDAELPDDIHAGERALERAEAIARRALASKEVQIFTELLQARSIGAAVVDEAIERGADAIVMSAAVRRRHGRPTIGETASYVLLNAPCEVVVVRLAPDDVTKLETAWR